MQPYFSLLIKCPLFAGIEEGELINMLACLGARVRHVAKRQTVLREGDPVLYVGIVLSGRVQIVQDDFWGHRSVIAAISPAELFAETFACAGIATMPVSVIADSDSVILLLECGRMLAPCPRACASHGRLTANLMRILASKNLLLRQKLELLARRTTRERLMAYLLSQAKASDSNRFTIPFDRQALADYLGVERSAMCTELGKLKREGLIDFKRSAFELLAPEDALPL